MSAQAPMAMNPVLLPSLTIQGQPCARSTVAPAPHRWSTTWPVALPPTTLLSKVTAELRRWVEGSCWEPSKNCSPWDPAGPERPKPCPLGALCPGGCGTPSGSHRSEARPGAQGFGAFPLRRRTSTFYKPDPVLGAGAKGALPFCLWVEGSPLHAQHPSRLTPHAGCSPVNRLLPPVPLPEGQSLLQPSWPPVCILTEHPRWTTPLG